MKPLLLDNARIIDPSRSMDELGSVLVIGDRIVDSGSSSRGQGVPEGGGRLDCRGLCLVPGLVDARVFVGEPGAEHLETITSASRAAVAGGVTTFLMMPDTNPVIDDVALVEFVLRMAQTSALMRILPMASITRGMNGKIMSEFGLLKHAGAVAFSEGRQTISSASLMRNAMAYARDFDMPIVHDTQDSDLIGNGVANSGLMASWLGLDGIVREAEIIPLERDLHLAALTGARYHAAQLSTAQSMEAIARFKQKNMRVSAGVSINHLSLNENDIGEYRTFFRLSPPLRSEEDRQAMIVALRDGLVDVITSSHEPRGQDAKRQPFGEAQAGSIGLETLLAASLRLYHDGSLPLMRLIELLSTAPARIFGLEAGTLRPGALADLCLVDLDEPWVVSLDNLQSRARNSVFENAHFQGRVIKTMVGGKFVYQSTHDEGQFLF